MKKIVYLLILTLTFSSCEDFLNVNPVHNPTIENSVVDYAGAKNIVQGMYAALNTTVSATGSVSTSDFFGGSPFLALSSQAGIGRAGGGVVFYNMAYTPTIGNFSTYWSNWHSCVNAANAAIISITKLDDNKFPSPKDKEDLINEARLFRAWVNSHLLWCFGHFWDTESELGILCREDISTLNNVFVDRKSVSESYAHILGDIEAGLKLTDYSTSKKLSKQVAQVLKAKILLNRGKGNDYKDALAIVDNVMATAPAAFKMNPDMSAMYNDAWDSKEVLWARFTEDNSYRAYGEGSYSLSLVQGGYKAVNKDAPEIPADVKEELINFFPEFATWIKEDPRYIITMGWARNVSATGDSYFCPTKLARKGRVIMNDKWTTYYIRYPELLLMQAELRARTGESIANSLAPINKMRSNRTNPQLPQIEQPATMSDLMDIIFKEYCLELYQENGSEWFASLRFTKDGQPWYKALKTDPILPESVTENQHCWPLPSTETNVNKNIKPNPGYDI